MPEAAAAEVVAPELFAGVGAAEGTGLAAVSGLPSADLALTGTAATAGGTASVLPSLTGVGAALKDAVTILAPAASLAAASSGLAAAKRPGFGTSSTPLTVLSPTPMPTLGGPDSILKTRGAVTEQLMRRGRASTILTAPDGEKLGS